MIRIMREKFNTGGAMRAILLLAIAGTLHAATVVNIACGGANDPGQGGYAWTAANEPALGTQTAPYNALRASYGAAPITYTLSVPAGQATVTLAFIEPNKTAAGLRKFNVTINGAVVTSGLDPFAVSGLLNPFSQKYQITSTGTVTIALTATLGNAVISGITITVPDVVSASASNQCEEGVRNTGMSADQGGLYPGQYILTSCENLGITPVPVTRFRCRSNVLGPTADLVVYPGGGPSLLSAPAVCTPDGAEAVVLPGASYLGALTFVITVPEPDVGAVTQWVLVTKQ